MLDGLQITDVKKQDWFSRPGSDHRVQFYSSRQVLLSPLRRYILQGLVNGDTCIVIAKRSHREGLEEQLTNSGFDSVAARARGQYIVLDAAETLAKFMVNGMPDRDRFFAVAGGLAEKASQNSQPIRVYGEMVALLWESGNKEAVIRLENLWNQLTKKYSLSLYCAYPELHFITYKEVLDEIKDCHKHAVA